jgi:hypothetical protein
MNDPTIRYNYQEPMGPPPTSPAGPPEAVALLPHERQWLLVSISRVQPSEPITPLLNRIVKEGIGPNPADTIALAPALLDSSPSNWRMRVIVAWMLGRWKIDGEEKDSAAHTLCATMQKRKYGLLETPLSRAAILAMGLSAFAMISARLAHAPQFAALAGGLALIWGLALFALLPGYRSGDLSNQSAERRVAIAALGRLKVIESIPVLTCAAVDRDMQLNKIADRALKATLPGLTTAHYGHLSADVVPNLCQVLLGFSRADPMVILDALEKIGDGRAIHAVTQLTDYYGPVRSRAKEVLSVLETRVREASEPYRLLRPSAPGEQGTLLRAAGAGAGEAESQLLRPEMPPQ